jgi:hypothetical protein
MILILIFMIFMKEISNLLTDEILRLETKTLINSISSIFLCLIFENLIRSKIALTQIFTKLISTNFKSCRKQINKYKCDVSRRQRLDDLKESRYVKK